MDSWSAAEDSEVEREKATKAAAAKAAADEEAKKNKKSKTQRIKEMEEKHRQEREEAGIVDESSEDEGDRRARMRKMEQEADLNNAADLFGNIGINKNRSAAKPITVNEGDQADPSQAVDLSAMKLFNPTTLAEFNTLKDTLIALVATQNSSKARYVLFAQDLVRALVKDLNSDQIKKAASALTTLSNEKMREEKAADKGGKKTKAVKTKVTLNASRDVAGRADTAAYDDGLEDDDFM